MKITSKGLVKLALALFVISLFTLIGISVWANIIVATGKAKSSVPYQAVTVAGISTMVLISTGLYLAYKFVWRMISILVPILLLCVVSYGQKVEIKRPGIKLFAVQLHQKNRPTPSFDTVQAIMTVEHRIKRDIAPITFIGYIVHSGRRVSYYDCNMAKIKPYYHVTKVEPYDPVENP